MREEAGMTGEGETGAEAGTRAEMLGGADAGMTAGTKEETINFRFAQRGDVPVILKFIRELADYEGMLDQVVATEELLTKWLFEQEKAEVLLGSRDGETVGFALFFHNFSTFLGRAGIYLEDLYVRPEYRGNGYGRTFLKQLAAIAVERGCGRLEWWCLDWNKPSIDFYIGMGAQAMSDWTVYRIDGARLAEMADEAY